MRWTQQFKSKGKGVTKATVAEEAKVASPRTFEAESHTASSSSANGTKVTEPLLVARHSSPAAVEEFGEFILADATPSEGVVVESPDSEFSDFETLRKQEEVVQSQVVPNLEEEDPEDFAEFQSSQAQGVISLFLYFNTVAMGMKSMNCNRNGAKDGSPSPECVRGSQFGGSASRRLAPGNRGKHEG